MVAVLVHAAAFIKRTKKEDLGLRRGSMLLWTVAALLLGPLVWLAWHCYKQNQTSQLSSQQLLSDYDGQKGPENDDSLRL